ncbi:MAG: hypothetical protein J2P29_17975, partial [Actinobacteria bacterium]|nr:hypothetical protein [Actinomycetota bacterium]
ERIAKQASAFGRPRLTRAAEIISAGLVEMRGATSPRLLLELMCAQVLLPAGSPDNADLADRLDRLERTLAASQPARQPERGSAAARAPAVPSAPAQQRAPQASREQRNDPAGLGAARPGAAVADAASLQARWPDVLEALQGRKRVASMQLSNARVASFADGVLTLAFDQPGIAKGFLVAGNDKVLADVLADMIGIRPHITASVGAGEPAPAASSPSPRGDDPKATRGGRRGQGAQPARPGPADRLDADGLTGTDLVERELGGRIIEEREE